jgi:hypothetical protein
MCVFCDVFISHVIMHVRMCVYVCSPSSNLATKPSSASLATVGSEASDGSMLVTNRS